MGGIGDGDNGGLFESFWATMQVVSFDQIKRRTRLELFNANFEYIDGYATGPGAAHG